MVDIPEHLLIRSAEARAKALGIPMGAPAFQYEKVFQKNNVEVFSSNFPLYLSLIHI